MAFDLGSIYFYVAVTELILAAILFAGGVLGRASWTMLSGFLIMVLAAYDAYVSFSGIDRNFMLNILIVANAMYFMSNGNRT